MACQPHYHHTLVGHIDIFHVAAVLLQIHPYLVEGILHLLLHHCFLLICHIVRFFETVYI